jgi:hypothetical protein
MKRILPIVEGEGDLTAVPELIRRVAHDAGRFDLTVLQPHKRGDLPKVLQRLENDLRVAQLEGCPVLWVLDYDCETCTDLDRDLAKFRGRVADAMPTQRVEVAFMVKEFESLFLADHETTTAVFPDIPPDLEWPADPESVRGAKEWISKARPKGLAYKETMHQAKLAAQVDLARLRQRSPSFRRFEDAVMALLS